MNDSGNSRRAARIAAERQLLAALCQGSLDARTRETALRRLARHHFAEPEHEVIFQAIEKLPTEKPPNAGRDATKDTREKLIAALMRRGFPDLDIEPFFSMAAPSGNEVSKLLEEIL